MSSFTFTSLNILLPIFVIIVLVAYLVIFYLTFRRRQVSKIDEVYLKLSQEIKFAVTPNFLELSLGVNELTDLAVEVWRMEQRIGKSASSLPENQLKGLENSIQKLKRYLEKYDIEIIDYKNQKFNEGLNLDILSVEKDSSLQHPIVKETVEPTIMCKGQVVRKAKVILLTNIQ